jgi:endonuclease/exonuclease/phosphatase family metal-dependent hydrolase
MKMEKAFTVASLNCDAGGYPGFRDEFKKLIMDTEPDVLALQEVHQSVDPNVPEILMPKKVGKREHPMRLRLHNELAEDYSEQYRALYAFHLNGLHDYESSKYAVRYGQTLLVHKRCKVIFSREDFVFGRVNQFNTESSGGLPAGKVALGVKLRTQRGETVFVTNVHGFRSTHGKSDCPERFAQNKGIRHHLSRMLCEGEAEPNVLCVGDLNYRSDMLALEDLRCKYVFGPDGGVILNHQFGVKRTRTDHYRNWHNEPEADFMIASASMAQKTLGFRVNLDFPSDHGVVIGQFDL